MFKTLPLLVESVFADSSGEEIPQINAAMIDNLVQNVTKWVLPIAGLLAFLFVVYGGYMWMMSAGDPDKVKRAQGILQWAVIGMIFTILVSVILQTILDAVA